MKKFSVSGWWWLFFALLFLLAEGIVSSRHYQQDHHSAYIGSIERQIARKLDDFNAVRRNDTLMRHIRTGNFNESIIEYLRQRKIMALVYNGKELRYWTSVAIDNTIGQYSDSIGFGMAEIKRGWYLYQTELVGKDRIMLCYPLYRRYMMSENPLLDEGFNSDLGIRAKAHFHIGDKQDGVPLAKDIFRTTVSVAFDDGSSPPNRQSPLLFFAGIFFLLLFFVNAFEYIEGRYSFRWAWLFLFVTVALLRFVSIALEYPLFINDLDWFSGDYYSLPPFFNSLGDLFLTSLLLFILVFSGFKGVLLASREQSRFNWKSLAKNQVPTVLFIVMMAFTAVILGVLQSLIHDSSLNFDVTNIFDSGSITLVGLLIAAMLLTIHFLGVNMLVIVVEKMEIGSRKLLYHFALSITVFLLGFWLSGLFEYVLFVQSVSYLIAVYITYQLVIRQNYFQKTVAILFIVSIFASSLFYRTIHDKERTQRQKLAGRVYSPKDLNAESVFLEIETKLEYDGFIRQYFQSPVLQKTQLEKRIKQLYFTGYLSRYEIDIFDFDTLGNSFKEMNQYTYPYLEEVYNKKTQSTISNHFYYVNDPGLSFGYMAKYEVCTETSSLGRLFILLKPKFVQDEKIFTELLSIPDPEAALDGDEYSYAIYQDGSLITHSGEYPYSLYYDFDYNPGKRFVLRNGYSHLLHSEKAGVSVVVSRKRDSFLEPVTIFSFLFLCFSLFIFLVFAINTAFMWLRIAVARFSGKKRQLASFYSWMNRFLPYRKFRGLFFSTRIQLSMIGLVLAALLLTGYFTIQYISFKYSERQNERLDSKVKSILSSIENEQRFEEIMLFNDELAAYLNQLAEFYNTDINLFSLQGDLLASTQMRIFQSGLLLDKINPIAYSQLSTELRSQHTQEERIGNLEYLAAYVPVFDGNHELIAYLNVPYFSNEKELRSELSSFLENFINIYVFFFILAGILAYLISQRITLPLILIQSRLAATRLGNRNERLEWRQQDEIGQLVRQYNSMVDKLEASALLLAKSEREDAWKEMAKQIAHEIKNPLTPMKLSVQHLQRAWANKNDNLDETFKRVTTVLIEQIDSLSLLATEFSSFAKMPIARAEEFELSEILTSIVELYFNSEEVKISLSTVKEPIRVFADKDQIFRAFHNILKNAIQSIPEGRKGEIEISLDHEDGRGIVRIKDNGCGMDAEVANRIFSPSFSTKNSGMGLGLAITKQIIENAGGSIRFETVPDRGTEFLVELPLEP